jgi:phosphate transport system protein
MSEQLQKEIQKVNRLILDVGTRVEESVRNAMDALKNMDVEKAEQIKQDDAIIDRMEVVVEEMCLKCLALHQPVAADLRYIFAVSKINNDLERIGDLASNIAGMVKQLEAYSSVILPDQLYDMSQKVQQMLKISLDSLVNKDAEMARSVLKMDDAVDEIHNGMFGYVKDKSLLNPMKMEQWLSVLSASRYLERMADHTTNISEDVIYMVDGEIARHGFTS